MKILLRIMLLMALCSTGMAFEFNRVAAGQIKGARLSWVSDTQIKIGVGYGENMGTYWEISATDTLNTSGYTLTNLSTTTNGVIQYIYIDRANSSIPRITVRNSTTAPAWSDDFMGWYDGIDRCIGAVWVLPDGKIRTFICPDDSTYHYIGPAIMTTSSISTTYPVWNSLNCNAYAPVNASELRL